MPSLDPGSQDLSQQNSSAGLSPSNYIPSITFQGSAFKDPIPMETRSEEGYQMEEPVEAHQNRDYSEDLEMLEPFGKTMAPSPPQLDSNSEIEDDWMENPQNEGLPGDSPANHTDCKPTKDTKSSSPVPTGLLEPIRLQPQVILPGIQIVTAKSQAIGFKPPLPPRKERLVLQDLLAQGGSNDASGPRNHTIPSRTERLDLMSSDGEQELEFTEFELTGFTIYLPDNRSHPFEMRGLNHLATRMAHSHLLFDGILSAGESRYYVQGIPFKICSIGNYGKENHEVGSHIWIQSDHNAGSDIYYRLTKPSPEYRRFHESFIWLANLAKHFVDYCQISGNGVSVWDFRSKFSQWMIKTHNDSAEFRSWYQRFGKSDFRVAIARNITFIYKEAVGVNQSLMSLPIWAVLLESNAVPRQEIEEDMTVVTPYVYDCFKELRFGHHLKVVEAASLSDTRHDLQGEILHLTGNEDLPNAGVPSASRRPGPIRTKTLNKDHKLQAQHKADAAAKRREQIAAIKPGDVLSVTKDSEGSFWQDEVSRWKVADECWYIYVQQVHISRDDQRSFDAIWLYEPSHTSCAKMKYPFPNELFLSDNCTCLGSRVEEDSVLGVVEVTWHGHPSHSSRKLFVRQTYLENERFVTLEDEHKVCQHLRGDSTPQPHYTIGQTVLVPPRHKTKHALEVFEIVEFVSSFSGSKTFAILRCLKRRFEIDGKGRPNELVYTAKTEKFHIDDIEGPCLVRFYSEAEIASGLPAPYCRDGTGNAFYITFRLVETDGNSVLEAIDEGLPKSLVQGFDPQAPNDRRKLRGLDLYCGGGNFGRGLEEGGAVRNEWAVDIDKQAIHTYYANLDGPNDCKLFWGSVNDVLTQAMKGNPKASALIPLPGEVEFISAGSPCQGFSSINPSKNNNKGLKNQSLVASVASYIDFYRPKYGFLENVLGITQKGKGREEDVLSQLICCVVGMGYQVRVFVLDAWSFGSAQSRSRLFVSFAAPGLEPPPHPRLSHAHHPKIPARAVGQLANGQSFGHRISGPTPFGVPTAAQATSGLPTIGDGATQHCTSYPDHVVPLGQSQELWNQIRLIPKHPRGMTLAKAWNKGQGIVTTADRQKYFGHLMYNSEGKMREVFSSNSKAFGRINPDGFFCTVLVSPRLYDARLGINIHWDEDRLMTLLEAKRAQGYPDDEVLVGLKTECWKILGNSVARTVSLALGLSLREAWLKSDLETLFPPAASGTAAKREVVSSNRYRDRELNNSKNLTVPIRRIELESGPPTTPKEKSIAPFKARPSQPLRRLAGLSDSDQSHSTTPKLTGSWSRSERDQNGTFAGPSRSHQHASQPGMILSEEPYKGSQPSSHDESQRHSEGSDLAASLDEEVEATREEEVRKLVNNFEVQIPARTQARLPRGHFETNTNNSLKRPSPMQQEDNTRLPDKRHKPSSSGSLPSISSKNSTSTVSQQWARSQAQVPTNVVSNSERGMADQADQANHFARRTKPIHSVKSSTNSGQFYPENTTTNTQARIAPQFRNSHSKAGFAEATYSSTTSLSPSAASRQAAQVENRTAHDPRTRIRDVPPKPQGRQKLTLQPQSSAKGPAVLINLVTDDEDSSSGLEQNSRSIPKPTVLPRDTVNLLTDDENDELSDPAFAMGSWRNSKEGREELRRRREHDEAQREYEQRQQQSRRHQPSASLQRPEQQGSPRQYIPVDNSEFTPYAQTHRYLVPRKSG